MKTFLIISLVLVGIILCIYFIEQITRYYKAKKTVGYSVPRLSFKQFQRFWLLNPDHWHWGVVNGDIDVIQFCPTRQYVWFKTLFDFIIADYWTDKWIKSEKKSTGKIQEIENTAKLMKYIQKDIDAVEARAKAEFDKQQKDLEKILADLPKSKPLGS